MIVYNVNCDCIENCDGSYVGQSKRYPHDRLSEHCRNVKYASDDKSVSTHFIETHNNVATSDRKFKSSILAKGKDYVDMMILEAEFIHERKPTMNNYAGKWKLLGS